MAKQVAPTDGPVVVTGASGYVGSHLVAALARRGYDVRACVTDRDDPKKTEHLRAINREDTSGRVSLFAANVMTDGSYDEAMAGCSAVLHAASPLRGGESPRQIYEGALEGTKNVVRSARRVGTVRRFVYTSSFRAVLHPAGAGYRFTERDWCSDNRENDPTWNDIGKGTMGDVAYAMAKMATEKWLYGIGEEDGEFDAISVCPSLVLGPVMAPTAIVGRGSWPYWIGRMVMGEPCGRGWQHLWNIVDVRDVAEAHARILESEICRNGDRYLLTATDGSGELNVAQLHALLAKLFPDYDIRGPSEEYEALIRARGAPIDPRVRCDKARRDLGLKTHAIEDTLFETGKSLVDLGVVKPRLKIA
ncbi:NAD-dependent epimerase/dehydratase family protein [Bradyrhizobium sp. PMVTL-01]|uniref:NAD-dependent epimerase/dehydratase family protein n=1 Tax=Bradyrhizobium sp. PMVTL-01 TaxID=3434999 RepID=UPI003F71F44E